MVNIESRPEGVMAVGNVSEAQLKRRQIQFASQVRAEK
jgi:hypothetical protein